MRCIRLLPTALLIALTSLFGCCGHDAMKASPAPVPAAAPTPPATTPGATASSTPAPATPATAMPTPPTEPSGTPSPAATQIATFATGCFWCTEAVLEQLPGVLDVTSGYMGGTVEQPTYQQVCTGETGHAECVQVIFDSGKITYETLLDWFFRSHDPTSLNRQGADEGTQYRSAIFYHSDEQKKAAQAAITKLQPKLTRQIVTELSPAVRFWPAEDYHQDYFKKHPNQGYCRAVIAPKLHKLGLEDAK